MSNSVSPVSASIDAWAFQQALSHRNDMNSNPAVKFLEAQKEADQKAEDERLEDDAADPNAEPEEPPIRPPKVPTSFA